MPTVERTSQLPTFPLTVRRQMVGFKQRLAERIIEAREAQGWDQRELAFRAKVSDKTIQRLEQAKVDNPRGSTLRKIAEATGREVPDLRPDMDTEERNLRDQLDRIERAVGEILAEIRGEPGEGGGGLPAPPPLERGLEPTLQAPDEPETDQADSAQQA